MRPVRAYLRRGILELLFALAWASVTLVTLGRWRVWRRGSLALGYWSETSDLDLTLFSAHSERLPNAVLWLWRFFGRFGEWAAYTASDQRWLELANPLELARDPKALAVYGVTSRPPSSAEAFVFWLRMSDAETDLQRGSRAGKWNHIRACVEQATGIEGHAAFPDFIEEYKERLSPIPAEEWESSEAFIRPQRWLTQALHARREFDTVLGGGTSEKIALARAQAQWEVWGVLGQLRLQKNFVQVERHFENLARMFPPGDPWRDVRAEFSRHTRTIGGSPA